MTRRISWRLGALHQVAKPLDHALAGLRRDFLDFLKPAPPPSRIPGARWLKPGGATYVVSGLKRSSATTTPGA